MRAARIRRLTLTNFRSYRAAQIEVAAGPIVLVGPCPLMIATSSPKGRSLSLIESNNCR